MDGAGLTKAADAIEHCELITLVYNERSLTGLDRIPFAFLLTSPTEVFLCHVKNASKRLGLTGDMQEDMDETLEMLVHHLCADERPDTSDADIVVTMTSGFGDVKACRTEAFNITEQERQEMQMNEGIMLSQEFAACLERRAQLQKELLEGLTVRVFPKAYLA